MTDDNKAERHGAAWTSDEDGEPLGWQDLCWIYGVLLGVPAAILGWLVWWALV